jgi:hypothetical protein
MPMNISFTLRKLTPVLVAVSLSAAAIYAAPAVAHSAEPSAHAASGCADPYSSTRDPANPLDLSTAPGSDPLTGAKFFVPGPQSGNAASTIAQLVGLNPASLSPSESWASFDQQLKAGPLHAKLAASTSLANRVSLLAKIAAEPQTERISSDSWGGTPAGIFKQTSKIFCSLMTGDPGTIPIFTTYFLHATLGGSPTPAQVRKYMPLFKQRVNAMAKATGNRPSVWLLELDGIGSTRGVAKTGALSLWEKALHYEMMKMESLPHTVVYVEGGYSDSNSAAYTAKVLKAVGIHQIRGFFTNDTHNEWTRKEDIWSAKVSKLVGGTHFIINTASNGRGPKLNRRPATQGVEDLCNPTGRGLGIPDTSTTDFPGADAYLWEHTPGNSSGCGGGPSGGTFWAAYAEGLASRASTQLGPS